jgi:pimeloyl-ACP methyl ester carboxylesterase
MSLKTFALACLIVAAPFAAEAASPNQLFPGSQIVAHDRFSVETIGHGPDVILIPGLASSRATFRRTATALKDQYTLHLVQVDGFAGEPVGPNASRPFFDPLVESLSAYLQSFGHPVPVIGHSLGGTLGLAIAERHPGLMSRLMLVDTLPFYTVVMAGPSATVEAVRPIVAQMQAKAAQAMPEAAARAMASQMITAPADVDRLVGWMQASDPQVVVNAMTEDMLADLRPSLTTVNVPVTVLYETPLKSLMESGYAPLRGVKLVEVPNAKHFIMDDQPQRFDAEVRTFLQ